MAKKSKAKAQKTVATKDLEAKDVKDVKGGKVSATPFIIKKTTDSSSPAFF